MEKKKADLIASAQVLDSLLIQTWFAQSRRLIHDRSCRGLTICGTHGKLKQIQNAREKERRRCCMNLVWTFIPSSVPQNRSFARSLQVDMFSVFRLEEKGLNNLCKCRECCRMIARVQRWMMIVQFRKGQVRKGRNAS